MQRPPSIIWFERCYLGAIIVGLISTALLWDVAIASVQDNPSVAKLGPGFMSTVMIGSLILGLGVKLLLWFGAAHKGWAVCKWFIAIFFVFGLLGTAFSAISGKFPHGLVGVLSVVGTILGALAVWFLFRPDTEAWFGEDQAA